VDSFIEDLNGGDLLLWPGSHTAFYVGGPEGNTLFHSHGAAGTKTGLYT